MDLRTCQHVGCVWYQRHIENCPDCYGWGRYHDADDRWEMTSGGALSAWPEDRLWTQCRACGGTPLGTAP